MIDFWFLRLFFLQLLSLYFLERGRQEITNDKRIWNEAIVAYFNLISWDLFVECK
jgi:hypothetical protein